MSVTDLWCRVYLAVQESQDPLELKEVKATLVLQVMMGHLDQRDREELLEVLVMRDHQDQKETL